MAAAQNAVEQVVLPIQPIRREEEHRGPVVLIQGIQNITEPLVVVAPEGQIDRDAVGGVRLLLDGRVGGLCLPAAAGGRTDAGRCRALVGLVIGPQLTGDGEGGRLHKLRVAEHHGAVLDPDDIPLVNGDHRVAQAEKAAHQRHRHKDLAAAENGPAVEVLPGDCVVAGVVVQVEGEKLPGVEQSGHARAAVVAERDVKADAGSVAAVKGGVGDVEHAPRPGGHGAVAEAHHTVVDDGEIDVPGGGGRPGQAQGQRQGAHQRQQPAQSAFHGSKSLLSLGCGHVQGCPRLISRTSVRPIR